MEYVQTMKVLHNEAPQSPLDELKTVLHEDLGETVRNESLFDKFCDKFTGLRIENEDIKKAQDIFWTMKLNWSQFTLQICVFVSSVS